MYVLTVSAIIVIAFLKARELRKKGFDQSVFNK